MGLGPPVIELYRQLKLQGALDNVTNVMELGSQDFWCPQQNLIKALFRAFGRPEPDPRLLTTSNTQQQPARLLYEGLGISYNCVDVDGRSGTLVLDMNFDKIPETEHNQYGLVTNHGTSEHILNQYNVFEMMHDLTRPGGVMVHAVPFTVHLEHGFFNYQPNFFEALARYNSYETLGLWVGPDWQLASFIPWDPILLDYLTINSKTTHLLVVAQRKMFDKGFCVPFQEIYENYVPDEARTRYEMVIDGEVLDGKRVKYLTKDEMLAREYKTEIMGLNNWIAAYKGEIEGLKHELAVTKHHFDQLRYGPPPEPWGTEIASLQQEMAELEAARQREMAELEAARQREMAELEAARQREMAELEAARQREMAARKREIAQLEVANLALLQATVDRTKALDLVAEFCRRAGRRLSRSIRPS
jgi:cell division protein FtsB